MNRARWWAPRPRHVGWFFLWTSGIHVGIVVADTDFYRHFADGALVPGLRSAWRSVFMTNASLGGLMVSAGEALLGLLLVARFRWWRRLGWAGTIVFHLALMCFGWGFWAWCVPAIGLLMAGARRDLTDLDGPGSSRAVTVVVRNR